MKTALRTFSAIVVLFSCAILSTSSSAAPKEEGVGWLAEDLTLRLTNVGALPEETVDLPERLLDTNYISFDASSAGHLSGAWIETEVWMMTRKLEVAKLKKMLLEVDTQKDVWVDHNDANMLGLRRAMPTPNFILIIPSNDTSRLDRFYCFWSESGFAGFVRGGYCGEAGEGIYQESPQAKIWQRHLPVLVQEMSETAKEQGATQVKPDAP